MPKDTRKRIFAKGMKKHEKLEGGIRKKLKANNDLLYYLKNRCLEVGTMPKYEVTLEFGLNIKELRKRQGLTSTEFVGELKDKVGLKITTGYLTCIEHYGSISHPRVIRKFAQFFDIRPLNNQHIKVQ